MILEVDLEVPVQLIRQDTDKNDNTQEHLKAGATSWGKDTNNFKRTLKTCSSRISLRNKYLAEDQAGTHVSTDKKFELFC